MFFTNTVVKVPSVILTWYPVQKLISNAWLILSDQNKQTKPPEVIPFVGISFNSINNLMHLKGRFRIIIHFYFTGLKMQEMEHSHRTQTQPHHEGRCLGSLHFCCAWVWSRHLAGHLNFTSSIYFSDVKPKENVYYSERSENVPSVGCSSKHTLTRTENSVLVSHLEVDFKHTTQSFILRVGLDEPQRSLPTPTILGFCDSLVTRTPHRRDNLLPISSPTSIASLQKTFSRAAIFISLLSTTRENRYFRIKSTARDFL